MQKNEFEKMLDKMFFEILKPDPTADVKAYEVELEMQGVIFRTDIYRLPELFKALQEISQ